MAQKFYAPHAVSMTLEDHRCHVYFSNESFETTEYSLTLSIRDLSGNVLETYETKGNSPAFSAIETAVVDICSWEDQKDDIFLEAVIHTKDQKVLKDVETLVPYKYLTLKARLYPRKQKKRMMLLSCTFPVTALLRLSLWILTMQMLFFLITFST